jgi:hypothetical protein
LTGKSFMDLDGCNGSVALPQQRPRRLRVPDNPPAAAAAASRWTRGEWSQVMAVDAVEGAGPEGLAGEEEGEKLLAGRCVRERRQRGGEINQ